MKVVIDIDGTITADPHRFTQIVDALYQINAKVWLLTGAADDPRRYVDNPEWRIEELVGLGFTPVDFPHIVECHTSDLEERGWMKAEFCKDKENGARIKIQAGFYPERLTLLKWLTVLSGGGTVTIGP